MSAEAEKEGHIACCTYAATISFFNQNKRLSFRLMSVECRYGVTSKSVSISRYFADQLKANQLFTPASACTTQGVTENSDSIAFRACVPVSPQNAEYFGPTIRWETNVLC